MVRYGRSSAGSYLADPTSPIPSHCASIATSTLIVKQALPLFQVAVTQHNDYEQSSSSPYNAIDPFDPVVNFQSYIEDNENIMDEVWKFTSQHFKGFLKSQVFSCILFACFLCVSSARPYSSELRK